jgi:CysZ protein
VALAPLTGASYLLHGIRLILRPGLRRFAAAPFLISALAFAALVIWAAHSLEHWLGQLAQWLPGWLEWLTWLAWPLFAASAVLLLVFAFSLVVNLIAAPFNALLAQAVLRDLNGENGRETSPAASAWRLAEEVANEVRKLWYIGWRAMVLLGLFLLPGVQLFAPLLWTGFSAWAVAFEYLDYPMSEEGLRLNKELDMLRQRRWLVMGFGVAVLGLTLVPVANFLVVPAAVAGGTALWVKELRPAVPPTAEGSVGRPG